MSCYTKMFQSTGTASCFLMQINEHGECVVHNIDKSGNPSSFACGDVYEVLRPALNSVGYDIFLMGVRRQSGWRFETWKEWCDALNGKGTKKAVAIALYSAMDNYSRIGWDRKSKSYVVTELGLKDDMSASDSRG